MSPFKEARQDAAVGHNTVSVMAGLKEFNQDGVSAKMEYKQDVAVARAGADGKPAHVIGIEFTDRLDNNEEFVRFCGGDIAGDLGNFPGWCGWCWFALSGVYTLAGLCHVDLDGFHVGQTVGFGVFAVEAGPGCVVACLYGSKPR